MPDASLVSGGQDVAMSINELECDLRAFCPASLLLVSGVDVYLICFAPPPRWRST